MNPWLVAGRRCALLALASLAGAVVGGVVGEVAQLVTGQAGFWLVGAEIGAIAGAILGGLRLR